MFTNTFFNRVLRFPEQVVNSRKLDTAFKKSTVNNFFDNIDEGTSMNHRILMLYLTKEELLQSVREPTLIGHVFIDVYNISKSGRYFKIRDKDLDIRASKLAVENIRFQHEWNLSSSTINHHHDKEKDFAIWCKNLSTSNSLESNLLALEEELGIVVERSGSIEHLLRNRHNRENLSLLKVQCMHKSKLLNMQYYWGKNVCIIIHNDITYLLPKEYILMLHNKLSDIISIIKLSKGTENVCYDIDARYVVCKVMYELARLSTVYGEEYYNIAKCLEAIVIGETLLEEEDWKNTYLLDSLKEELEKIGYFYEGSNLEELIKDVSIPLKQELGGLSKIFGHPFVDIGGTVESLYNKVTCDKLLNPVAIQETVLIATETYIRNYILKHGSWPDINFREHAHPGLILAHRLNLDPKSTRIVREHGQIDLQEYVNIDFNKSFELDKLQHYSEYLKDKTISMCKSKVVRKYLDKEHRREDWLETRLLLVHLLNTEDQLGAQEYLEDYIRSQDDLEECLNFLVIKLVPKEKELKVLGRPFGCKTYQDRYRTNVQETNMASYMDKYELDQSMTLDHLQLIKRLHSFRNLKSIYKGWRVLYVNFDVSGWNTNFRDQTVKPILEKVHDKIYGVEFFSKTHTAYEKGFFYLPDGNKTYTWDGQGGGVEGQNQYDWMEVYLPQMQYALRAFNLHFFVMAYGDDYKAAILIPPNQSHVDISTFKDLIVQTVSDTVITSFGQQMKFFDSYGSECYISFCKNASVRQVELPQGFRKIQKCYGANNAFLPTLDEYISSAYSNAHSAAKTLPCYYGCYYVAAYWSYYHILIHKSYENASTDYHFHAMLLIPSVLGGLPTIMLHNFATRSEADHLTSFIDFVFWTKNRYNELFKLLRKGFTFNIPEEMSFEGLLRDPYSLPLDKPPLASTVLRNQIIPILRPIIKNEEFLELLDAAEDDWSDRFVKTLVSSEVLQPRLLSSLYSCLPKSIIEEYGRRFESSASVKDLLIIRTGAKRTQKLLRKVIKAELRLQEWRVKRIISEFEYMDDHWIEPDPFCPTVVSKHVRRTWGRDMIGVIMPPVQHLIKFTPSLGINATSHDIYNHFTYHHHVPEKQLRKNTSPHWKVGSAKPFLGYKTRLGSEMPQVRVTENNAMLSKMQTVSDAISWCNKSMTMPDGTVRISNLPDAIKILLHQFFPENPDLLSPFGSLRKSGTVTHHWRSPHFKEHIMPNTLQNIYTHWRGEVNTHLNLRGSIDHLSLNFLQILCHAINILSISLQYSNDYGQLLDSYWGVTTDCDTCMEPIVEPPIIVDLSHIENISPRVLQMTKIDNISQKVLQESLIMYEGKRYKVPTISRNLDIELAAMGVAQKFIDQSMRDTMRIQNRFNTGPLASGTENLLSAWGGGQESVLVRETEMRHIPPLLLLNSLSCYIYTYLLKKFNTAISTEIEEYLLMEHPNAFPWARMLEMIHRAGMLGPLIREAKSRTGTIPPVCYDNPIAAARYIGQVSISLVENGSMKPICMALSYFEDDEFETLVMSMSVLLKEKMMRVLIWREIKSIYTVTEQDDIYRTFLGLLYYISLCSTIDYLDLINMLEDDVNAIEINVQILELDVCDAESYENELDNVNSLLNRCRRKLVRIYPRYEGYMSYHEYVQRSGISREIIENNEENLLHAKVYRGVISHCINIIREGPSYIDRIDSTPPPRALHGGIMRDAILLEPLLISNMDNIDMPRVGTVVVADIENIYDCEEILLSGHSVWRIYSCGTSSMNKIIELFSIIGLSVDRLRYLNVATVGEGYGGILNYFANMMSNCHFLYNSKPPTDTSMNMPDLAVEALRNNNHTLDNRLMCADVYDLSNDLVIQKLIECDNLLYHIVTCDAELPWDNISLYRKLILGVVKYWLVKRTDNSILICKVMGEAKNTIVETLSILSHYSRFTRIYRLFSSPPGGELYIVSMNVRRAYTTKVSEQVPLQKSPVIERRLTGFLNRHRFNMGTLYPDVDIEVDLFPLPIQPALRTINHLFPPTYQQLISGRHSISIEWSRYRMLPTIDRIKHVIRIIHSITLNIENDMVTQGRNLRAAWDDDTHARSIKLAERYLLCISITTWLTRIFIDGNGSLSQGQIRQMFIDYVTKLPFRTGLTTPDNTYFRKEIMVHNIATKPFYYWMEGVKISLSAYGYESSLQ